MVFQQQRNRLENQLWKSWCTWTHPKLQPFNAAFQTPVLIWWTRLWEPTRGSSDGKRPFCSLAATVDSLTTGVQSEAVSQRKKRKRASLKAKRRRGRWKQVELPWPVSEPTDGEAGTADSCLITKSTTVAGIGIFRWICVLIGHIKEFRYLTAEFLTSSQFSSVPVARRA